MTRGWYTLIVLVIFIRLCRTQNTTFSVDKVKAAIDENNDNNITRSEVEDFFTSSIGSNTTGRCQFMNWLEQGYDGSSLRVSALFDLMQSSNGVVGLGDFMKAFFGTSNATEISITAFMANIRALDAMINKVLMMPADSNTGPTFWSPSQFEIQQWADNTDLDHNGILSMQEVSTAMRKLDENGDWKIKRCEYVNSLTAYRQHSICSSKVYDVIFSERDITWADIDSTFLIVMMGAKDFNATKSMFVEFFTLQNLIAAGQNPTDDGSSNPGGGAISTFTSGLLCYVTSTVLVFFTSFTAQYMYF